MHHRISGYNRAAMSQRRKDAAFADTMKVIHKAIKSIVDDAADRWVKNGIDRKDMFHASKD
jgi:hypothetical protein